MSKAGHLKRRVNREIARQLRKRADKGPLEGRRILNRFGRFALWVITIPSAVVGVLQLLPRVSISLETPLTPSNALSVPFLVSNDGYLTIHNVNVFCAPRDMVYVDPSDSRRTTTLTGGPDDTETGGVRNPDLEIDELPPAVKTTFPCALAYAPLGSRADPTWLTSGHMVLIVKYTAPFMPFIKRYHRQRFDLVREESGTFRWKEGPLRHSSAN